MKTAGSSEKRRGGRKGFVFKLLKSHLLVASIGLITLLIALAFTFYLRSKIVVLTEEVEPITQASSEVLTGVQHSLAGLRGWVSLDNEEFLREWKRAWEEGIKPAMRSLITNRDILKRYGIEDLLNQLLPHLAELEESQWWVKSVAQTPGNEPARVSYLFEVGPVAVSLDAIFASIVQEAKTGQELLQKEEIIGLLDAQRHFSIARLVLEEIISEGSFHLENKFRNNLRLVREAVADTKIQGSYHSPEQKTLFKLFERESLIFGELADKVIHQRKSDKWNMAQYLMATETVPISKMVIDVTTMLSSKCIDLMREESSTAARAVQIVIVVMAILIAVMMFTAFLISRARARGLTVPVSALSTAALEFAEGRLEQDIPVMTDDELGDLTRAFNSMRGSLSQAREKLRDANLYLEQRVEKRTEELKSSRDMTERYLSVSEAMIVGLDATGKTILINRRGCDVTGYGEMEIIGKNWFDTFIPSEQKEEALAAHNKLISGEIEQAEYFQNEIITKTGNRRFIFWHNTVLKNEDGTATGTLSSGQNVTEQREAEEELKKHREHLEELVRKRTAELEEKTDKTEESRKALTYLVEDVNKAREDLEKANRDIGAVNRELQDFAYIVSHDLKAPLRAVSQLAYWISQDYAEVLDEDGKEHLNLLSGRVKRMDALINGILQYSRLGRAKEKQDKIDLDKTLPSIIKTLAPPENIRITIENELPEIVGNNTHMEQVFQNLIGNAIKFMDKPEGLITIGCRDEGSRWEFRITDNGPGIHEKYHERIFKIFQTLVPRDEHESTGIGLTLVKKTIEQYDGKIWVESEVGKRSSFVFTLPKK